MEEREINVRWQRLCEQSKQQMMEHLAINIYPRPLWQRILLAPTVFAGHFKISYRGGSAWWFALRMASSFTWVYLRTNIKKIQ